MRTIKTLQEEIKTTINTINGKASFTNGHDYGRYFTRNWQQMNTNIILLSLSRYNSHLIYNEKEKSFKVSDQLVHTLTTMLKEKFNMYKTTHVGCFDIISNSILKQAMLDCSYSIEELNEKKEEWKEYNNKIKLVDKLRKNLQNKEEVSQSRMKI